MHTFTFFSACDPQTNNNKVVNNSLGGSEPDPAGTVGVSVGAFDLDFPAPGFDPTAQNNKVIHNTIAGFDATVTDVGTGTKAHANVSGS